MRTGARSLPFRRQNAWSSTTRQQGLSVSCSLPPSPAVGSSSSERPFLPSLLRTICVRTTRLSTSTCSSSRARCESWSARNRISCKRAMRSTSELASRTALRISATSAVAIWQSLITPRLVEDLLFRVLTRRHGGCTFTVRQTRRGAILEAGGTADADGARAQARNLSAFCCVWRRSTPFHPIAHRCCAIQRLVLESAAGSSNEFAGARRPLPIEGKALPTSEVECEQDEHPYRRHRGIGRRTWRCSWPCPRRKYCPVLRALDESGEQRSPTDCGARRCCLCPQFASGKPRPGSGSGRRSRRDRRRSRTSVREGLVLELLRRSSGLLALPEAQSGASVHDLRRNW